MRLPIGSTGRSGCGKFETVERRRRETRIAGYDRRWWRHLDHFWRFLDLQTFSQVCGKRRDESRKRHRSPLIDGSPPLRGVDRWIRSDQRFQQRYPLFGLLLATAPR